MKNKRAMSLVLAIIFLLTISLTACSPRTTEDTNPGDSPTDSENPIAPSQSGTPITETADPSPAASSSPDISGSPTQSPDNGTATPNPTPTPGTGDGTATPAPDPSASQEPEQFILPSISLEDIETRRFEQGNGLLGPQDIGFVTTVNLWISDGESKPTMLPISLTGNHDDENNASSLIVNTPSPTQVMSIIIPTSTPTPIIIPTLSPSPTPAPANSLTLYPKVTPKPYTIVPIEPTYKLFNEPIHIHKSDSSVWIAFETVGGSNSTGIVWQVSNTSFENSSTGWENPKGLLKSSRINLTKGEFLLDLDELDGLKEDLIPDSIKDNPAVLLSLNNSQNVYYIRAIAIDNSGDIVGTPGKGMKISKGERIPELSLMGGGITGSLYMPFDLFVAREQGQTIFTGEFRNDFVDSSEIVVDSTVNIPYHFRPSDFPDTADTMILQVSRVPFVNDVGDWQSPTGLLYYVKYEKGTQNFDNLQNETFSYPIYFNHFSQSDKAIYYVRATALSPGTKPGTVKEHYSKSIKVFYSNPGDSEFEYFNPPPVIQIDANLPDVRLKEYHPVRWEDWEWPYFYEVQRQPTYDEYIGGMSGYDLPNKDELVTGLPVGTIIDLSPSYVGGGDSWYEKALGAMSGFYDSIASAFSFFSDSISEGYDYLKDELVEFIAYSVYIPEPLSSELLRDALIAWVDYGLYLSGTPDSIPPLDELASGNSEYIVKAIFDQAGFYDSQSFDDGVIRDIAETVSQELDRQMAAIRQTIAPNPFNWDFVRYNQSTMYKPAHLILTFTNNSKERTPRGLLDGNVRIVLSDSDLANPTINTIAVKLGNTKEFELFLPIYDLPIPPLDPGESLDVPIFLEEHIGHPYYYNPNNYEMTRNDFIYMSNNFGKWTYDFNITYDLPSAKDYADEHNWLSSDPYAIYEYNAISNGVLFKTEQYKQVIN